MVERNILENVKCNCKRCNGTGIMFTYAKGTKGSMCVNCNGTGYIIVNKVFQIGNEFYTKLIGKKFVTVTLFSEKNILDDIKKVAIPSDNNNFIETDYQDFLNNNTNKKIKKKINI